MHLVNLTYPLYPLSSKEFDLEKLMRLQKDPLHMSKLEILGSRPDGSHSHSFLKSRNKLTLNTSCASKCHQHEALSDLHKEEAKFQRKLAERQRKLYLRMIRSTQTHNPLVLHESQSKRINRMYQAKLQTGESRKQLMRLWAASMAPDFVLVNDVLIKRIGRIETKLVDWENVRKTRNIFHSAIAAWRSSEWTCWKIEK